MTALAVTDPFNPYGDFRIVSGGGGEESRTFCSLWLMGDIFRPDGQVRVWRVTKQVQVLECAMKEHKGKLPSPLTESETGLH